MEEKYTFWWENLPEIWKKILTSHFYHLNEVKKDENDTKIIELGTLFLKIMKISINYKSLFG